MEFDVAFQSFQFYLPVVIKTNFFLKKVTFPFLTSALVHRDNRIGF